MSAPEFREFVLDGRRILLTRLPTGEAVAFAAACPHQGTSLSQASIYEGALRCPRHNYVYDLHTGSNIVPTRDARPGALARLDPGCLPIYRVEERGGWIRVAERPNPPPATADPVPPPPPPPGVAHRGRARDAPSRGRRRTAAAGASTAQAAGGDDPPGVAPPGVAAPAEARTVACGEAFVLVLVTKPRPSHFWRVEPDSDAVEVTGQDFTSQPDGTVRQRIRCRARAEGTVIVTCAYTLPWSLEPREVRRFTVSVVAPR